MKQAHYLPITWASNISVQPQGDQLLVTGKIPLMDSDIEHMGDPYLGYVTSVKSQFAQKTTGKRSPHIRFANAADDKRLTAFVRQFGPVVPSEVARREPLDSVQQGHTDSRSTITAVQTLATLRTERQTYAAALRLMIELKRGRDKSDASAILQHVSMITDGVWCWPVQYEAERVWRGQEGRWGPTAWHFDTESRTLFSKFKREVEWRLQFEKMPAPNRDSYSDFDNYLKAFSLHMLNSGLRPRAYERGHDVLCGLINAFRTEVQYLYDYPIEAIPLFSLRFGIRQHST